MLFEDNIPYLVLKVLITILGTFCMSASTSRFRSNHQKCFLVFAVYLASTMAVSFCIIYFCGYMLFSWAFLFVTTLPAVFMLFMIFDESPARLIFTCTSHILFSLYVAASVTLLNALIHGNELTDIVLRLLAYSAMILLEFLFLRHIFLQIADTITKGWAILSPIPCAFIILSVTIGQFPTNYTKTPSSIVLIYLLGGVIIIIYYAILKYLWTQYHLSMKEHNCEILELQLQNIKSQAADMKRKTEIAQMLRQDTLHMLSAVGTLAKAGNTKAILDYVRETSSFNNTAASARYCSDPILNATLSTYLGRAENSGIMIELHLSIPDMLPVDSAELSICFANALENAINACEKLLKNERKIIVKCIHKPKLMFEISNPYKGKVAFARNGLPYSSKTGHGIGTRSIMAFCEKYNAFYEFTAEGGWFRITVAL